MSHILEYTLSLQDKMSAKLKQIGLTSDSALSKLRQLQKQAHSTGSAFGNIGKIAGMFGVGFGMFKMVEMMHQGVEKAHELHAAEAQLKNTMQNMGTYSKEAFENVVKGSGELAKNFLYSRAEVIGLQSQIRMVGSVGELEMQRLVTASADMATKFGMGLGEAGNAIAKAVNNPEMLRRLSMQLKIDPAIVKHLQDLAKHGHEAQARLELLNIVEQKVGGAAKAAFDADPLSRYNKVIGSMKVQLGEASLKMQAALAPALIRLAKLFTNVIDVVSKAIVFFTEHKKTTIALGVTLGILAVAINWVNIVTGVYAAVVSTVTFVINLWTGAQWLLNIAMSINPITWIIIGIIALIALITFLVVKVDGWGKTWHNTMEYMKLGWQLFKDSAVLIWLELKDAFISGFEIIEKGWYKLKSLWDKSGANAGLASLQKESFDRANEISKAKNKVTETAKAMSNMKVFELSMNNKTLGGVTKSLTNELGIGGKGKSAGLSGSDVGASSDTISSGGSKPTNITINLGKLMDSVNIHSQNLKEGTEEMEKRVVEVMMRVLNSGNAVAGR